MDPPPVQGRALTLCIVPRESRARASISDTRRRGAPPRFGASGFERRRRSGTTSSPTPFRLSSPSPRWGSRSASDASGTIPGQSIGGCPNASRARRCGPSRVSREGRHTRMRGAMWVPSRRGRCGRPWGESAPSHLGNLPTCPAPPGWTTCGMASPASTSRTANAVVRRIEALQRQAADLEGRCLHQRDRAELAKAALALEEARAWLRAATPAEPVLVTHVATMVTAACGRLYTVARHVG